MLKKEGLKQNTKVSVQGIASACHENAFLAHLSKHKKTFVFYFYDSIESAMQ